MTFEPKKKKTEKKTFLFQTKLMSDEKISNVNANIWLSKSQMNQILFAFYFEIFGGITDFAKSTI